MLIQLPIIMWLYGVISKPLTYIADFSAETINTIKTIVEAPETINEAIRRLSEVIEDRLELYRAFIAAGAIKE